VIIIRDGVSQEVIKFKCGLQDGALTQQNLCPYTEKKKQKNPLANLLALSLYPWA
jgi:hypothetical protein